MARNAILFWLTILFAVFAGIYFRGYKDKEKIPLIVHKDWANCVQPTVDGGYVIAGVIWGMGGMQSAVYLVKTDAHGGKLWCRIFRRGDVNCGNSVQQTLDLGYIVAGTTWPKDEKHSDIYLVKTDPDGNAIWSRTYGGNWRDEGHSVRQTTDGGYIVADQTDSFGDGNGEVYLMKTDAEGNLVWGKTFGGKGPAYGHSVCRTRDGGYIVAGKTEDMDGGDDDIYLIKTYGDGARAWRMTGACP